MSFIEYATEEENIEKFIDWSRGGIHPRAVMSQVDDDWMENPLTSDEHYELYIPPSELKNVIEKNLQSSHWSKISQVLSQEVQRDFTMLLRKLAKDKFREMYSAQKAKADEEDERVDRFADMMDEEDEA